MPPPRKPLSCSSDAELRSIRSDEDGAELGGAFGAGRAATAAGFAITGAAGGGAPGADGAGIAVNAAAGGTSVGARPRGRAFSRAGWVAIGKKVAAAAGAARSATARGASPTRLPNGAAGGGVEPAELVGGAATAAVGGISV